MDYDLNAMTSILPIWNEMQKEKNSFTRSLLLGIALLVFGIMFFLAFQINREETGTLIFPIILPVAGVAVLIYSTIRNANATSLKEKIKEIDVEAYEQLEEIYKRIKNCKPIKDETVFEFHHVEGFGKNKRLFRWNVKLENNLFIIVNKTRPEIQFVIPVSMNIQPNKGFLSSAYDSDVFLNGQHYKIHIYPDHYKVYERLIAAVKADTQRQAQDKSETLSDEQGNKPDQNGDDDIVKFEY